MYWRWAFLLFFIFFSNTIYGQQCPTFNFLKLNDTTTPQKFCSVDSMKFSADVKNTLGIDSIEFYWDSTSNFNPYIGQGQKLATTSIKVEISATPCQVCPQIQAIFINACNGSGLESDNEFMIFNSGSGSKASDIQLKYNANNTGQDGHINLSGSSCSIQNPTLGLLDSIRSNIGCNLTNVIPINTSDTIPPNATVIFFHSRTVTKRYDLSNFCQSGNILYVMQSSCKRTIGAYGNSSSVNTDSLVLTISTCPNCKDIFKHSRVGMNNTDGIYAIRDSSGVSSVAKGTVLLNSTNPCEGPLTNYTPAFLNVTPVKFNIKDYSKTNANFGVCGYDTLYFKAIFKNHPNTFSCRNTASVATSNTIKALIYCPDISITGDSIMCQGKGTTLKVQKKYLKPLLPIESYLWDDKSTLATRNVINPGNYSVKMSQDICSDSSSIKIVQTNATIHKINPILDSCISVSYLGRTYYNDTTIKDTFRTKIGQCDSLIITQQIQIGKTKARKEQACIVNGNNYTFYGKTYNTPGIYIKTIPLDKKCDSVISLFLDVISPKKDTGNILFGCNSYDYKNNSYTNDTFVIDTLFSAYGCDSIYRIFPIKVYKTFVLKDTIKKGCDSVLFGTQYYKRDTLFTNIITYKNLNSCDSIIQNVIIKIVSTPILEIIDSPKSTQYIGDFIKLSSSLISKSYKWSWNNDFSHSIKFLMEKDIDIWLKTIDSNNCISNASFRIFPKEKEKIFSLPTAFSPNGDFRNDIFKPDYQKTIEIVSMMIYNRIGELVYYGLGDQVGWDGKYKGEIQQNGSYLCTVLYRKEGVLKRYTSTFDLIR